MVKVATFGEKIFRGFVLGCQGGWRLVVCGNLGVFRGPAKVRGKILWKNVARSILFAESSNRLGEMAERLKAHAWKA